MVKPVYLESGELFCIDLEYIERNPLKNEIVDEEKENELQNKNPK